MRISYGTSYVIIIGPAPSGLPERGTVWPSRGALVLLYSRAKPDRPCPGEECYVEIDMATSSEGFSFFSDSQAATKGLPRAVKFRNGLLSRPRV